MGVAREVGQNLLWSGERRLGVDVPAGVIERFEEGLECRRVGELGVRTEELQSALRMCCFEQCQHLGECQIFCVRGFREGGSSVGSCISRIPPSNAWWPTRAGQRALSRP